MPDPQRQSATQLLREVASGKRESLDALLPIVYDELRRIARSQLRQEAPGRTLGPTALVHEAYMRLVGSEAKDWQGKAHFFGAAANLMRQILVDHARARLAQKRGGGNRRVTFSEVMQCEDNQPEVLLAIDKALRQLAELDPQQARIVELRFFAGLTIEEVAEALSLGLTTVKRDWRLAKAWLSRELS